ncbi:bifunctional metallophosphatase/5'-nucleotidase [Clostridium sp.]
MQRCNKLIIIISIIIFSVVIGIQYKTINAYEIENKNSKIIRDEFNLVEENNKVIDILTFNDFHGKVLESEKNIGASKLTSIIKEYKIKEKENGKYGVITVAGGNLYESTGISKKLNEEVVNKMMDEIGVVASVIGNHEYDLGRNNLRNLSNQVNFKFVASNLIDEETGSVPEYAVPYVIEEVENINVAFIGIVTEGILKNEKLGNIKGLKVLDALDSLNKYSEEVRGKGADIIIALTNLPSEKDEDNIIIGEAAEIAKKANDIDAVISSNSHKFIDGFIENEISGKNIPIVQAGYNGRGLSVLNFTVDEDNNVINVKANTRVFYNESPENEFEEDIAIKKIVEEYKEKLNSMLYEKVTELNFDLIHDGENSLSKLGVTIAETLREIGNTQVSIINGDRIKDSLYKGDVTVEDIYKILPFDDKIITVKVTGAKLKELIKHGINTYEFGWGQFSGLTVYYDSSRDKITSIQLNDGSEVNDEEYYTLTTIDFLINGGNEYDFGEDIDFEVIGEMRELIKERWKNYGIKLINYNLIIDLKEDDKESSVEINPDIISDDDDENNIENEDEYFEYLNSNKNNNDEGESEDEEIESEGIKEFIPIMLTISMGIGVGKIIFSKY